MARWTAGLRLVVEAKMD